MIALEAESPIWSRRRWLGMIVLALMLQVGMIFWLAERKPATPLPPVKGPSMYLPSDQTADLPGVSDPTLFVLANPRGFSGPAWMNIPKEKYQLKEWEPELPPALKPELGRTLNEIVQGNLSRPFEVASKPGPQLDNILYTWPTNLTAAKSRLTIEGGLAGRPLLSNFQLKSWQSSGILTNSEVLVGVNSAGVVFSPVLLAKCGPKDNPAANDADTSALNLAKSARFQPLRWSGPGQPAASPDQLAWGKLVFHWHTTPLPATNAPPKNP